MRSLIIQENVDFLGFTQEEEESLFQFAALIMQLDKTEPKNKVDNSEELFRRAGLKSALNFFAEEQQPVNQGKIDGNVQQAKSVSQGKQMSSGGVFQIFEQNYDCDHVDQGKTYNYTNQKNFGGVNQGKTFEEIHLGKTVQQGKTIGYVNQCKSFVGVNQGKSLNNIAGNINQGKTYDYVSQGKAEALSQMNVFDIIEYFRYDQPKQPDYTLQQNLLIGVM